MRVGVIGAGYVGLTAAACLAELGHVVRCADIDRRRIEALEVGGIDLFEPGLAEMIRANRDAGRLAFTVESAEAAAGADVVLIAVGTPADGEGGADLHFLHAAAHAIAAALDPDAVVAIKSTVPAGTGEGVEALVERPVVANPEFLREGSAISDFITPDRIVIGAQDRRAAGRMLELYRPLTDRGIPLVSMSRRSAELTKYAANALLAMKVAFANEMADLAEALEADALDILAAVGLDRRIGPAFLRPGPGIGGSCFPKDTEALAGQGRGNGAPALLVEAAVAANQARRERMLKKVIAAVGGDMTGRTIAVLGLAFKANTDDVRESPALPLIEGLRAAGAAVRVYDPQAMQRARPVLADAVAAADAYEAARGADAVVIVTEWPEFARLDLDRLGRNMARPVIVDLRNLIDPGAARKLGFHYSGVGRGGHHG